MDTTEITCPKLTGAELAWHAYRGFSILFDESATEPEQGRVQDLASIPEREPASRRAFDRLAFAVEGLVGDGVFGRRTFRPLPRSSFHVTVCDGIDETKLSQVGADERLAAQTFLRELPGSLEQRAPRPVRLYLDHMPAIGGATLTFGVVGSSVWGHALVARLSPLTDIDRRRFIALARARRSLVDLVRTRLGLETPPWRPHVTLGYFANRAVAEEAERQRGGWERVVLEGIDGARVGVRDTALYGFTDMASYYRAPTT